MGNRFGKKRVPDCRCEDNLTCGPCLAASVQTAPAVHTEPKMWRRLVITISPLGFVIETEWQNRLGYWSTLSRTMTQTFPLHIVGRVADRDDYKIYIRAKGGQ